jgi:hypothetical protein
MVLSNTIVNSFRVAANYTDVHRIHVPIGFDTTDVGVNIHNYLEDYMLLNVTGGFSLGGGTESEARFKTPSYQLSDDLTVVRGNHQFGLGASLAFWRSLSRANVRSPASSRRCRTRSTCSSGTPAPTCWTPGRRRRT